MQVEDSLVVFVLCEVYYVFKGILNFVVNEDYENVEDLKEVDVYVRMV